MDGKTISPVDVLFNGPRSDFLPETISKLRSINSIIDKLKKHKSAHWADMGGHMDLINLIDDCSLF